MFVEEIPVNQVSMTRDFNFSSNSKRRCRKYDRTDNRNYNLFLKALGYCRSCNGKKSLPYTKKQHHMEGEGVKQFFEMCGPEG